MKKTKLIKLKLVTGMLIASCICFTGCGKNGKDDIASDLRVEDVGSGSDAGSDVNTNVGDTGTDGNLQYTVQGTNGKNIIVDAKVDVVNKDRINVYEESLLDVGDDETIAQWAKTLYDGGEYQIIKPVIACDEAELNERKVDLEAEAAGYGEDEVPERIGYDLAGVEYYLSTPDEREYTETEKDKILYPEGNHYSGILLGKIGEEDWSMEISSGYKVATSGNLAYLQSPDNYIVSIKPYNNYYWYAGNYYGMEESVLVNNACDLQEAKRNADEAVEKLGFKDVAIIDTKQLIPEGGSSANPDGYFFTYAKSIEGLSVAYSDFTVSFVDEMKISSKQEYIHVSVTTEGIMCVEFDTMYELGSVISENAVIMDFDKVEEIAREQMVKQLETPGGKDITVNEIKLAYMSITYDGAGSSLVPVWIYYGDTKNGSGSEKTPLFAINALDGEVIQFVQMFFY